MELPKYHGVGGVHVPFRLDSIRFITSNEENDHLCDELLQPPCILALIVNDFISTLPFTRIKVQMVSTIRVARIP